MNYGEAVIRGVIKQKVRCNNEQWFVSEVTGLSELFIFFFFRRKGICHVIEPELEGEKIRRCCCALLNTDVESEVPRTVETGSGSVCKTCRSWDELHANSKQSMLCIRTRKMSV